MVGQKTDDVARSRTAERLWHGLNWWGLGGAPAPGCALTEGSLWGNRAW